ncbi:MAG: glycoside hydrolase 15-related protein [Acidobacteriales bacterium]|nr:glycoside hydrolase 15-related protein [Terriglobales bacterium]
MSEKIEDYGVIGDLETMALVSRRGTIAWLCWPRFDSPACFASLLGSAENGHWTIAPAARFTTTRRYRPHTLILETTFKTKTGTVLITDFMPPRQQHSQVIRIVRGIRGEVKMNMELALRFDYGRVVPWVSRSRPDHAKGLWTALCGPHELSLATPVELIGKDLTTVSEFTVTKGQTIPFVLTYGRWRKRKPQLAKTALASTEKFWKEWCARSTYKGEWKEQVERSLVTLKSLTFAPTGGILAAPTSSLPEWIGGKRNWDYRFCWLRDSTFLLLCLLEAGYAAEASAWRKWLVRAVAGSPELVQIMYTITGKRIHHEWIADWLSGYENSKPVRVGNAAANQVQLDIYGEVMDALYHARRAGIRGSTVGSNLEVVLLDHLEKVWDKPDDGIWEVRSGGQNYTYSKMMAWVAFDRGVKMIEEFQTKGPLERWRKIRDTIHADVCAKGFHRGKLNAFTQAYGSRELDASMLLMPLVGFLPADDARVISTVAAIEKRLMKGGFVLRYDTETTPDGLPAGEGVFLACSFWLVDVYHLQGREREAQRLFKRLLSLANDLGLLSEEYDPRRKRLLGNFPQAFSHIGLLNSAFNLSQTMSSPAKKRAKT